MVDCIRVVAPATLEEGFSFEVLVDGKPFVVVVPDGGVKEGQEFEVPYPSSDSTDATSATLDVPGGKDVAVAVMDQYDSIGAPMGQWRTSLCSCCDVVTQATPWMACFCVPVFLGQLLTRMHLAWHGRRTTRQEASLSFNRIVMSYIAVLYLASIPTFGSVAQILYAVVLTGVIGFRMRRHFRKKYRIPASCCGKCSEALDDLCCVLCCGCCSLVQMARHTHNDKVS